MDDMNSSEPASGESASPAASIKILGQSEMAARAGEGVMRALRARMAGESIGSAPARIITKKSVSADDSLNRLVAANTLAELEFWKEEVLRKYEVSEQKEINEKEKLIKDALRRAIVETMREESAGKIGRRFTMKAGEGDYAKPSP